MGQVIRETWDGSVRSRPRVVVRPASVDEIAAILRDPDRFPSPVRASGSNHSVTACAAADGGTVVDMRGWNRILRIGPETVAVQAGALYLDVARELARHGLQLFLNPEIGNLTMGAAACCGTKDASMPGELGQASSYVVSMKLVTPDGKEREVTSADGDLLRVLRSSYGLLGVVHEVVFRVRPLRPLAVHHLRFTRERFAREWPELRRRSDSLMLYLFPHLDAVAVELRRYRPGAVPASGGAWPWWLRNAWWRGFSPRYSRLVTRHVPGRRVRAALLNGMDGLIGLVLRGVLRSTRSRPSEQIIRFPERAGLARYTFSFWAFPEEGFPGLLAEYFGFCREHERRTGFRCDLLNVSYRIARDDSSLLSYSSDGAVMTLDPVSTGGEGWREFLTAFNEFCSARGGRPLLNQTPALTREQVRKAFGERLVTLEEHRRRLDPGGRLLNDYFRDLLAPAGTKA